MEWLAPLKVAPPQGEAIIEVERSKLVQEKCKRKIFEATKTEKSYKFKEYPLGEKVSLDIDAKSRQHQKRIA